MITRHVIVGVQPQPGHPVGLAVFAVSMMIGTSETAHSDQATSSPGRPGSIRSTPPGPGSAARHIQGFLPGPVHQHGIMLFQERPYGVADLPLIMDHRRGPPGTAGPGTRELRTAAAHPSPPGLNLS